MNVNLHGKKGFADVIKDLDMGKWSWITGEDFKFSHLYLYERGQREN